MFRTAVALLLTVAALGCTRPREYELRGQVLAVDTERGELTIRHDDIPGFMPGMTMPFKVADPGEMQGRVPGDLVRATLVVRETEAYLSRVERVGHSPLTEGDEPAAASPIAMPGDLAPDVRFVDQDGHERRLSDFRGSVVAVTFIYTRCPVPTFCPLMDRNFAAVQRELAATARPDRRAHLLSVSFDPEFDTPAVLGAHAARAGADKNRWSFVTGARTELEPFAKAFGVTMIRSDADEIEIIHNLRTAVIDPQGRIVTIFSGNEWTPTDLVRAMRAAGA
jgi:protein SCO1/2